MTKKSEEVVAMAFEDYAKRKAIKFAKFTSTYTPYSDTITNEIHWEGDEGESFSTEELYSLFEEN